MADTLSGMEDDLDVDALRAKYRFERDRRIHKQGSNQYTSIEGDLVGYLEDPYVEPGFERAPIETQVETLIIGGGFGGMLSAARLRQAGADDFLVIEKGGDYGGTWYWNRYPGAACDTESYVYMPMLEETGYIPSRKYAKAAEIYEHCQRIARKFDLYERALFQTLVTGMVWNEDDNLWDVSTSRNDKIRARFVVIGAGGLQVPKLPGIPGIEDFQGHSFHTSRWDYAYTGGDAMGGLDKLGDKRVGVIGTGATAVQCVPHLAQGAKELFVFQRTPSAICQRDDRPTDEAWAQSLKPGWQRARMDNFTSVISGIPVEEDLVNDGWCDVIGGVVLAPRKAKAAGHIVDDPAAVLERADFSTMNRVRGRVDEIIDDPETADILKPWYGVLCKRPCFHDEYLPTFNRENVHLIDASKTGIEKVTPNGVVVDGQEIELDCLVFATGFEVAVEIKNRLGFEIVGVDGLTMSEKWKEGAETLHGFFVNGFPNCILISPTQSGQSANFTHMLDEQSKHTSYVIGRAKELNIERFEASVEAEKEWVQEIVNSARGRQKYMNECTPGYYNYEGEGFDLKATKSSQYWKGPLAFVEILKTWRSDGSMPGLELR